jgi:hypothetical protein
MNGPDLGRAEMVLIANRIETCLVEFIENFYIQFLGNSCGIKIEGITTSDFEIIKKSLGPDFGQKKVTGVFEKAIHLKDKLQKAVYNSPPTVADLIEAYRDFVPELLLAFEEDGKGSQGFDTFDQRVEKVLRSIESLKELLESLLKK